MKHAKLFILITISAFSLSSTAQVYDDYIGAGHDQGVTVWTSSNQGPAVGENTINGNGLDAMKMEASRFLSQAAFGGQPAQINALVVSDNNFSAWIDQQMQEPTSWMLPKLYEVDQRAELLFYVENDTNYVDDMGNRPFQGSEYFGPYSLHFQYAWWDNNLSGSDQLRQRVAYALSQIMVISINSNLAEFGEGLSSYYDHFMRYSFGNFEDLLSAVALDPNMGFYLSHLNNNKTDAARGINPDENFAREIMQLFSIGLYELNNNGTRKVDGEGNWIPTYDNSDINGLAKVFTGLKGGEWSAEAIHYGQDPNEPIYFGADIGSISRTVPMQMDNENHEPGAKTIVGNFTIPNGQTGIKDIEDAVHHLFMHDNVGPFIARRLIQQLIKSNPTPAYLNRVASTFNNNGNGIRGDMAAVIRAVLLDSEARECSAMQDPNHGKLREPILRFTHIANALPHENPDGYYWNNADDYREDTRQEVLHAPSVFNFYLPTYQAQGAITKANLTSPEFQIHDSQTSLGYMNQVHKWTMWSEDGGILFWDYIGQDVNGNDLTPNVETELRSISNLAADPETLLNHLDVVLTHGRLSQETRAIIKDALISEPLMYGDSLLNRVRLAVYLIMISPDYVILK